jgi:hypothetical protein
VILPQLRRVRWAVRATLVLGVAASVAANILHALDNPISQAIAAWPPLALLLTVELISRVPVHRRSLAVARLFATATIAGIAAWVSYWHMAGVAARYGETGASAYLLPLSVDGLIVVASICLVELGSHISTLEREARAEKLEKEARAEAAATALASRSLDQSPVGEQGSVTGVPGLIPVPAAATARRSPTAAALAEAAATLPRAGMPKTRGAEVSAFAPTMTRQGRVTVSTATKPSMQPSAKTAVRPAAKTAAKTALKTAAQPTVKTAAKPPAPAKKAAAKPRRTPAETLATAARIKKANPAITDAELATELGISASRWRTIRREAGQEDLHLAA